MSAPSSPQPDDDHTERSRRSPGQSATPADEFPEQSQVDISQLAEKIAVKNAELYRRLAQ